MANDLISAVYNEFMNEPFFSKVEIIDKSNYLLVMADGVLIGIVKDDDSVYYIVDYFSGNYHAPLVRYSVQEVIDFLVSLINRFRKYKRIPFLWYLKRRFL